MVGRDGAEGAILDTVTLTPSGTVPRVETRSEVGEVSDEGVPITFVSFGGIADLPSPQPGVYLVCSLIVATAAVNKGRTDIVFPGPLVRNDRGQPIGCMGLSRPTRS